MTWFTSFSAVHMDDPLFGDLENDQFFGRATFKALTGKQIAFHKGTLDILFRGNFTVGTNEIIDGAIGSVTSATSGILNWTMTAVPGFTIQDVLDRASHLDPVGDFGANIGVNALLLQFSDRIDDQSTGASYLAGYGGSDTLLGNAGNDTLDGGTSQDLMLGGLGNDTYVVDNTSDVVLELPAEGTDVLQSAVTYTLPDNVEKLTLIGTANITGRGNALANTMTGNIGDNGLFGRGGADSLTGGTGDDTLEGGPGNDLLTGSGGSDTASYLHATSGVTVSLITTAQSTGGAGTDTFASIENLLGSQFDDSLTGNNGDNVLEGGRGNDTLNGGGTSDSDIASFVHAKSAVTANLSTNQSTSTTEGTDTLSNIENLTGGTFGDNLTGDGNVNVLTGGLGNDSLTGGAGNDQFIFDVQSGFDTIFDFTPGADAIILMSIAFPGFDIEDPGVVLPNEFISGAGLTTVTVQASEQRLVYNTTNGFLYYDSDGFIGGSVQIATLPAGLTQLAASDFHIG